MVKITSTKSKKFKISPRNDKDLEEFIDALDKLYKNGASAQETAEYIVAHKWTNLKLKKKKNSRKKSKNGKVK